MSNLLTGVSMVSTKCTVGQCVGLDRHWQLRVSNVCAMQFWWFVEYVFRYFFSLAYNLLEKYFRRKGRRKGSTKGGYGDSRKR